MNNTTANTFKVQLLERFLYICNVQTSHLFLDKDSPKPFSDHLIFFLLSWNAIKILFRVFIKFYLML